MLKEDSVLAPYRRRFRYDDWANRAVLESLAQHRPQPPITVRWMAHILACRWLWLERLIGRQQSHPVWPEWSLEECAAHGSTSSAAWTGYLESLDGASLLLSIQYRNSKGEAFSSQVADVLDHVLLHGAYHRGQISSALRHAGVEPPYTDFIHAARNGLID
jgi:uncharacterized damage-inducible protein DinB